MHPAFRFAVSAVLACHLGAMPPARAADPANPLPVIAMQHTSWNAADGAPAGVVRRRHWK
ncbi:hypothetical protein QPK31_10515 [Massilia sp. YIM B02769]|uniref:hypothetical protein n=1 Tax=unclassified Massilia TaxID=2609279 RepID=UPI0025B692A2|nr:MULTISPECIES: hypothetical protein [unclassified Massilia]MDN4058654.1 hypothetical protein [Massilia sp. YIM B02769]